MGLLKNQTKPSTGSFTNSLALKLGYSRQACVAHEFVSVAWDASVFGKTTVPELASAP